CLQLRWRTSDLQQNGRSGQAQAGVDIFGPDDLGRSVGIQCKLTIDELTLREVEEEISKAETFEPGLEAFFIVTSGERDAKIQTEVRRISDARRAARKFPVAILFWDDLMADLTTSPAHFAKHYPQLGGAVPTAERPLDEAKKKELVRFAEEQERIYGHFMAETRKPGGAVSRNRATWIQHARAAAEACAGAHRAAGDELSALRWDQIAKTTL
ncbi:MAG TPA: hypothetical protein VF407_16100, partial [Polyangiaceae bacterium]